MKSIVSYPVRGTGGKNNYRGNCSPHLIRDIITQYKMEELNDYMCGSGTTEDVCKQMGIETSCYDLNRGYDLISNDIKERPQNIFWHPPYADMIVYSDQMYSADKIIKEYGFDPRINDLSRCNGWDDFVKKMNYCMNKQFASLEKGGRMCVLMGDMKRSGKLYSMYSEICKPGMLEQIIIKTQHNCMSDNNTYANANFVPIIHEYLMVVKKPNATYYPITMTKTHYFDMRDSNCTTWKDVVAAIMEDYGRQTLAEIYKKIEGHKKCESNQNWQAKVRQTLQKSNLFTSSERGVWMLVA